MNVCLLQNREPLRCHYEGNTVKRTVLGKLHGIFNEHVWACPANHLTYHLRLHCRQGIQFRHKNTMASLAAGAKINFKRPFALRWQETMETSHVGQFQAPWHGHPPGIEVHREAGVEPEGGMGVKAPPLGKISSL